MNISAISSTPIKPQTSFGNIADNHKQLNEIAVRINEQTEDKKDLKNALAIALSLASLVGASYSAGKLASTLATKSYGAIAKKLNNVGKDVADDVAEAVKKEVLNPELGLQMEAGLKKLAGSGKNLVSKLTTVADDGVNLTKSQMAKNTVAGALDKTIDVSKKVYNKIASFGLKEGATASEIAQSGLNRLAGGIAVAAAVPSVVSRDADEDGTKDIFQKSQVAYTSKMDDMNKLQSNMKLFADILSVIA